MSVCLSVSLSKKKKKKSKEINISIKKKNCYFKPNTSNFWTLVPEFVNTILCGRLALNTKNQSRDMSLSHACSHMPSLVIVHPFGNQTFKILLHLFLAEVTKSQVKSWITVLDIQHSQQQTQQSQKQSITSTAQYLRFTYRSIAYPPKQQKQQQQLVTWCSMLYTIV